MVKWSQTRGPEHRQWKASSTFAMNSNTRVTLLERLRDGSDALAWDEFFDRYWRLIFASAKRRGCSEHTAEEIVQDVMLAVFENKHVFRYDPAQGFTQGQLLRRGGELDPFEYLQCRIRVHHTAVNPFLSTGGSPMP